MFAFRTKLLILARASGMLMSLVLTEECTSADSGAKCCTHSRADHDSGRMVKQFDPNNNE